MNDNFTRESHTIKINNESYWTNYIRSRNILLKVKFNVINILAQYIYNIHTQIIPIQRKIDMI